MIIIMIIIMKGIKVLVIKKKINRNIIYNRNHHKKEKIKNFLVIQNFKKCRVFKKKII